MRRNTLLNIGLVGCMMVLIAIAVLSVTGVTSLAQIGSAKESDWETGGGTVSEPVKNLDIDWTSGEVSIEYHSEDTVEISETARKEISEDRQLCWRLDGDTLEIRYEKPGFRLPSINSLEKKLTVTLPEGTVLGDADIDITSAVVTIPSLQAENLNLDITSGEVMASVQAKQITGDSTSGDVYLVLTGDAEEISLTSGSGNITLEGENSGKVKTDSTSGNIMVTMKDVDDFRSGTTSGKIDAQLGETKTIKADSTSGDVSVKAAGADTVEMDSTSGKVTLSLPAEPGFTAHLDTTSGHIDYDLPLTKQGDAYICGDGSTEVKIDTTSGNIQIK